VKCYRIISTIQVVFWVITLCSVVVGYKYFRVPCCIHLQCEGLKTCSNDVNSSVNVLAALYGSSSQEVIIRRSLSAYWTLSHICLNCTSKERSMQGRALAPSVCEVIMVPSTETPGIEMLWHLPDIWHILFHMTTKGVVWEREDTYISQDVLLAL